MVACDYCGTTILFGGVRDDKRRYCNENCHQQGFLLALADQFSGDVVAKYAKQVQEGDCPKCGGPGPIDVHTSYSIWSVVVLTSWRSRPVLCCQACGTKSKLGGLLSSTLLGWWSLPGLLLTPVQILRNIGGLISSSDPLVPSPQLEKMVRVSLAAQHLEQSARQHSDASFPEDSGVRARG